MKKSKLNEAASTIAGNLDPWQLQNGWQLNHRGRKGVYELLESYYGLSGLNLHAFYRLLNFGDEYTFKYTHVLRHCERVLFDQNLEYDEVRELYVDRTLVSHLQAKYSIDALLGFLQGATQRIVVVQSYLESCARYGELVQVLDEEVEVSFILPKPDGLFAAYRNRSPHPYAGVDIPTRIGECTKLLRRAWEERGKPDNVRLLYFDGFLPVCLYVADEVYRYAPFYPHSFAAYSYFQTLNSRDKMTENIQDMIAYLHMHAEVVFGAPYSLEV